MLVAFSEKALWVFDPARMHAPPTQVAWASVTRVDHESYIIALEHRPGGGGGGPGGALRRSISGGGGGGDAPVAVLRLPCSDAADRQFVHEHCVALLKESRERNAA